MSNPMDISPRSWDQPPESDICPVCGADLDDDGKCEADDEICTYEAIDTTDYDDRGD